MKSQNKLISIGIPVHNGADYLHEALNSITSQTYNNLEIIISDDRSTDDSPEIIENFTKKDSRIKIFTQKTNIGSLPNFNFVLKQAKGEYFMWAAQDDRRDKYAVEKLFNLLEKFPEAILSVSDYHNIYKNKTYPVYKNVPYDNESSHLESIIYFIKTYNIPFFYGLYKTKVLQKSGGYFTDNRWFYKGSDYMSIYKALLLGKFVRTDEVLFFKRDTGHFTEQKTILEKKIIDEVVITKILRYLTLPLYFTKDLFLCFYFVSTSSFSLGEKLQIVFHLVRRYLINIGHFCGNIITAVMQFLHLS